MPQSIADLLVFEGHRAVRCDSHSPLPKRGWKVLEHFLYRLIELPDVLLRPAGDDVTGRASPYQPLGACVEHVDDQRPHFVVLHIGGRVTKASPEPAIKP